MRSAAAADVAEQGVQITDVLIQDPVRSCAYFIPSAELEGYRADTRTWPMVDAGTVTFCIPTDDIVCEAPPFRQAADLPPSVLIQDPDGQASYFLTFDQLQAFRVECPVEDIRYGVSFRIPQSLELIEELPAMQRANLQSGEVDIEARIRRLSTR